MAHTDDERPAKRSEDNGARRGAVGELRSVMSEAAITVLSPVAKRVATNAAKLAVQRGPELVEEKVMPALQGEQRKPAQHSLDVAAPLDDVYDRFSEFASSEWDADIVEDEQAERLAWKANGGSGVATFHDLSDRLTRIELTITGGPRFAQRSTRAGLRRFKASVELGDDGGERAPKRQTKRAPTRRRQQQKRTRTRTKSKA